MPQGKKAEAADTQKFDRDLKAAKDNGGSVALVIEQAVRKEIAARNEAVNNFEDTAADLLAAVQESTSTTKDLAARVDRLEGVVSNYVEATKQLTKEVSAAQKSREAEVNKQLASLKESVDQIEVNVGSLLGEVSRSNKNDEEQEKEITDVKHLVLTTKEKQEKELTGVKAQTQALGTKVTALGAFKVGVGGGTFIFLWEVGKAIFKHFAG